MVSRIATTKATLSDIARRAGVSTATASRVLNGSGRASAEAKAAIFGAASELGYRRAAVIDAPAARPEELVEVVWHWHSPYDTVRLDAAGGLDFGAPVAVGGADDAGAASRFGHSFFQDILNGILDELARNGRTAAVRMCHDLLDARFLADVNAPGRVGAILLGEFAPEAADFAAACRVPLVFADQDIDAGADVVAIDNASGILESVCRLAALGHRGIGFVGGSAENPSFAARRRAWEWGMREHGLPIRVEWTAACHGELAAASAAVGAILSRANRPTALVCANDNLALAVYRAAGALGLAIPRDLSVTGFDDIDLAPLLSPPLTTVAVPSVQIGRLAVRLLLSRIATPPRADEPAARAVVRTRFVERASTGPPPPPRPPHRKKTP